MMNYGLFKSVDQSVHTTVCGFLYITSLFPSQCAFCFPSAVSPIKVLLVLADEVLI